MNTNRISAVHVHSPEIVAVTDFGGFVTVNLNSVSLFFASPAEAVSFAADLIAKASNPDKPGA